MKKKHCTFWIMAGVVTSLLMIQFSAIAADKVVVIPLFGSGSGDNIPTVTSTTGRIWMDRNLGAIRVAGSKSDSLSYGWLYQWGRPADGHESRTSPPSILLDDLSNGEIPGHGNFIRVINDPRDWTTPQNNSLWQGVNGKNNPCPPGFRIPTSQEWQQEVNSWTNQDPDGAFASPLKLTQAGNRAYNTANIGGEGNTGTYWSSTASGVRAIGLIFNPLGVEYVGVWRATGYTARCIKD